MYGEHALAVASSANKRGKSMHQVTAAWETVSMAVSSMDIDLAMRQHSRHRSTCIGEKNIEELIPGFLRSDQKNAQHKIIVTSLHVASSSPRLS